MGNLETKLDNREMLSRSSILAKLASKGVMSCVSQEVNDIYYVLEHEFPSDLALKVLPLLSKISKLGGKFTFASSVPEVQFSQYVPALEKLPALRSLQQVSKVYQTMKIDNFAGLIPFFDFSVVEKIYVDAVKQKFLSRKVDHMKNVVTFCKTGTSRQTHYHFLLDEIGFSPDDLQELVHSLSSVSEHHCYFCCCSNMLCALDCFLDWTVHEV